MLACLLKRVFLFGSNYVEAGLNALFSPYHVDMNTWLVNDVLVNVDRTTMAYSVDARHPFLDHRLVKKDFVR